MFTVLTLKVQMQLESNPALHRFLHCLFPCISQIVETEVELGQDRVDLQRLRDRLGAIVADFVVEQVEVGQDRS